MARMSNRCWCLSLLLALLVVALAPPVAAQEAAPRPDDGILSLTFENDLVAGTDLVHALHVSQ